MLRNRPAAFMCLLFSAGIAVGLFFGVKAFAASLFATLLCFAVRRFPRKQSALPLLVSASLLIGTGYSTAYKLLASPPAPQSDTTYSFTAAVTSTTVYTDGVRTELTVQDKSCPFDGYSFYMYSDTAERAVCDVVKVYGTVKESSIFAKSNGVYYVAYGKCVLLDGVEPSGAVFAVARFRQRIGDVADKCFKGDAAGFYRALIVGDRSGVDTEVNASFSRSGILHILAVSGQHFSILIIGFYRLIMRLFGRKKLCSAVAIAAAVAYALFTGLSPSVLRAAFMCCAVFAGNIFKAKTDSLINLSLALTVLVLIQPYAIVNTGLLLSFVSTAGIILSLHQLDKYYDNHRVKPLFRWFLTPATLSVSATLFCMPIFLWCFDFVSIASPITNVLADVLVAPTMLVGIVAMLFRFGFLSRIAELLFKLLLFISDTVGGFKLSCISLHTPYIWLLIVPTSVIAVLYLFFRFKKGMGVLAVSAAASVLISLCCHGALIYGYDKAPLLYVNDGSAGGYVLYSDGESFVFVDGGGSKSAVDGIMRSGCSYADVYVITRCTDDAYKRLKSTLPYIPADTICLPEDGGVTGKSIAAYCKKRGSKVVTYDPTAGLAAAGVYIYGSDSGAVLVTCGTVAVFGSGEGLLRGVDGTCDTLVVTRAFAKSDCDANCLPIDCKSFYADKSAIKFAADVNVGGEVYQYGGELCLRLGKNGAYEVDINE